MYGHVRGPACYCYRDCKCDGASGSTHRTVTAIATCQPSAGDRVTTLVPTPCHPTHTPHLHEPRSEFPSPACALHPAGRGQSRSASVPLIRVSSNGPEPKHTHTSHYELGAEATREQWPMVPFLAAIKNLTGALANGCSAHVSAPRNWVTRHFRSAFRQLGSPSPSCIPLPRT